MFYFLGYKLENGTTVLIGEQASTNDQANIHKQFAIETVDATGSYTRDLNQVVAGLVWLCHGYKGRPEQIDDCIELANGKYSYNDSRSYGDVTDGVRIEAADLRNGEWVSVSTADVLNGNVIYFTDYIKSFN